VNKNMLECSRTRRRVHC